MVSHKWNAWTLNTSEAHMVLVPKYMHTAYVRLPWHVILYIQKLVFLFIEMVVWHAFPWQGEKERRKNKTSNPSGRTDQQSGNTAYCSRTTNKHGNRLNRPTSETPTLNKERQRETHNLVWFKAAHTNIPHSTPSSTHSTPLYAPFRPISIN